MMHSTHASSRECQEKAIEAEIKSLEDSIRVLKLRRNALQPISCFPPEIFNAIFSFLCLGAKSTSNRARFRISHVCRQWREIALDQPELWSRVDFNVFGLEGATESLNRAKSLSLFVKCRYDHNFTQFRQFLYQVQARLPYIRHLRIDTLFSKKFSTFFEDLNNVLVSPAPTLEYLSLFREVDEPNTGMGQVSDTLFGGSTPRLSHLKLNNCKISWNSMLLKGLRTLEINIPHEMDRPTLAVWLDTLGESAQLQTLTLHTASPVAIHFPFDVKRMVMLQSLTRFDITASLIDCAFAMAHLDLPALTSLCLTETHHSSSRHSTNPQHVHEYLSYIGRHFHGPQDIRPLQSVLIHSCKSADNPYLLAWTVPDIDAAVIHDPLGTSMKISTRVKLSLRSDYYPHSYLGIFKLLTSALPLDDLLTLVAVHVGTKGYRVNYHYTQYSQFWLDLLPNWPLLRRVLLKHHLSEGFIEALLQDSDHTNPLLPSLTELALVDASEPQDLCDMLMKRVEEGVPLETLDLRGCGKNSFSPVAVQLLSEIVVNVLPPCTIRV